MGNVTLPSIAMIFILKAEREHVTSALFSAGLKTAGGKKMYKDQTTDHGVTVQSNTSHKPPQMLTNYLCLLCYSQDLGAEDNLRYYLIKCHLEVNRKKFP
jgi:hypothetical protein